MDGIFLYESCKITDVTYSYVVGNSPDFINSLEIFVKGIGTEDSLFPRKNDGFSFYVEMPKDILTMGQDGLISYLEKSINKYKVE